MVTGPAARWRRRKPACALVAVVLIVVWSAPSAASAVRSAAPEGSGGFRVKVPASQGVTFLDLETCTGLRGPWQGSFVVPQAPPVSFTLNKGLSGSFVGSYSGVETSDPEHPITETFSYVVPVHISKGAQPTMSFPGATTRAEFTGENLNEVNGPGPFRPLVDQAWPVEPLGDSGCQCPTGGDQQAITSPGQPGHPHDLELIASRSRAPASVPADADADAASLIGVMDELARQPRPDVAKTVSLVPALKDLYKQLFKQPAGCQGRHEKALYRKVARQLATLLKKLLPNVGTYTPAQLQQLLEVASIYGVMATLVPEIYNALATEVRSAADRSAASECDQIEFMTQALIGVHQSEFDFRSLLQKAEACASK